MKSLFSIGIFFTICSTTSAQNDFGIKINGGLSKITANRELTNATSEYKFAPSGQGGLFYNLHPGKRSLIGAELLFSMIESKETMKITYNDKFGNPLNDYFITNLDYHISYFSIPVYYGYKIKGLTINLGAQASLALSSRGHWIGTAPSNGSILTFEGEDELNIDSYDFGPRAGIMYDLSKRLAVEASYYYGINNILSNTAPPEWIWKIQQITLGLRYKFFTHNRKDSSTVKSGATHYD